MRHTRYFCVIQERERERERKYYLGLEGIGSEQETGLWLLRNDNIKTKALQLLQRSHDAVL